MQIFGGTQLSLANDMANIVGRLIGLGGESIAAKLGLVPNTGEYGVADRALNNGFTINKSVGDLAGSHPIKAHEGIHSESVWNKVFAPLLMGRK